MKRILFSLFLFAACSSGGGVMSMSAFYDVPVGTSPQELVETQGEPFAIHKVADGALEYEYVERIKVGYRNLETRRYFLLVKDGRVVSKRIVMSEPSPLFFDSYEMQTTQNSPDERQE